MMVIATWVALVSAVILVFAHIILLIVNKKYRKKITNICSIIVTIVLLPILLIYNVGKCCCANTGREFCSIL